MSEHDDAAPPPAARPARLAVGVVGTGRVGAVLGAALAAVGHRVVAASAVSERSRERAEALLPGVPLVTPQEVLAAADLVLLTVPDDALPEPRGRARGDRVGARRASCWPTPRAGTASRCSTRPRRSAGCRSRCTRS